MRTQTWASTKRQESRGGCGPEVFGFKPTLFTPADGKPYPDA